jgi:hypothetical protein
VSSAAELEKLTGNDTSAYAGRATKPESRERQTRQTKRYVRMMRSKGQQLYV